MRYTHSHTLASILTLQSVYVQNHGRLEYEDQCADILIPCHLAKSLRKLYAFQGLYVFSECLYIAAIYELFNFALTSVLTTTFFRPVIAKVVAMVLLSETHMAWTHATISPGKSRWRIRLWPRDHKRWSNLLLPSVV